MSASQNPKARSEGILKQRTFEDLVVVDEKLDQAHTLNETAAVVFESADGSRSVEEIVDVLREKVNGEADADLVELTLDHLAGADLLVDRGPRSSDAQRQSRRRFVRKIGVMGALSMMLPVVESIASPTKDSHRSPTKKKHPKKKAPKKKAPKKKAPKKKAPKKKNPKKKTTKKKSTKKKSNKKK